MKEMHLTTAFLSALQALRAAVPRKFRYRGFAPRAPAFLPEEKALLPELLELARDLVPELLREPLQQEPELLEALVLRSLRIALVEELALGALVGSDGAEVSRSRGTTVGRRALRRIVDERDEARQLPPWSAWAAREVDALERLAAHVGTLVMALCDEHLRGSRPPPAQRRRAELDAGGIASAIEAGQLWS